MITSFALEERIHATLAGFVDLLLDAVCVVDADGRYVFVSAAFERIFGYAPEEVIGRRMIELVAPEDRDRTLQAAEEIMAGFPKLNLENRYIHKDGQVVHIRWSARWSEEHQLRIAIAHDITDRKHTEYLQAALFAISEAAHSAENLRELFQSIHQIIASLLPAANFSVAMRDDQNGELTFPYEAEDNNESAALRTTATTAFCADIVRTGRSRLLTTDCLTDLPEQLRDMGDSNAVCWVGVPLTSPKGAIGALVLKSYSCDCHYTEKDKDLLQFVSTQVLTAIERKQMQARLQYMAQYDELTALPNRALLHDRLEHALARAQRQKGQMAVLYLDLDSFKLVNDTHGHNTGDLLLKEVAIRLKRSVRNTDTVGRMSGDEFVVVLENVHPDNAAIMSEKIRRAISEPVTIGVAILHIQPSIGIATYPHHGDNAKQLLMHADEAMYAEKKQRS